MSKLTLDEAIEYYINVATQRAVADEGMGMNDKWHECRWVNMMVQSHNKRARMDGDTDA